MQGPRATFEVKINLDLIPGAFHEAEDARIRLLSILENAIGHYNPEVTVTHDPRQEHLIDCPVFDGDKCTCDAIDMSPEAQKMRWLEWLTRRGDDHDDHEPHSS